MTVLDFQGIIDRGYGKKMQINVARDDDDDDIEIYGLFVFLRKDEFDSLKGKDSDE